MPLTDSLGCPLEPRVRRRANSAATPDASPAYMRAAKADARQRSLVATLHGVPGTGATSRKAQTDSIINLLADLTSAVERDGADQALTDGQIERLLGMKPSAPLARAFRQGFATGTEVVAESGSWAHQRWRGLHNEMATLPVRRSIARRAGTCTLPAVRAALGRIQRAARSLDGRDWQHAGATAATLAEALATSQAISPGGRGTHVLRTGGSGHTRATKSCSVEVGPNFWVDESDVVYTSDGRPKLKPGAEAKYRYHDDYKDK